MTTGKRPDGNIFASGAGEGEVLEFPSVPRGWGVTVDGKDETGEKVADPTNGIPPMEWVNALQQRTDNSLLWLLQNALPDWIAGIWPAGSVIVNNDIVYRALKETATEPTDSAGDWLVLFPLADLDKRYLHADASGDFYPESGGDLNGPIVSKYSGAALQKNADAWNDGASANVIFTAHGRDSEYVVNSDFYLKDGEYWAYRIYTGGGGSGIKVFEFRNGGDFHCPGAVYDSGYRVYSALNCPFPVGYVMLMGNTTNPQTLYPGTTWQSLNSDYDGRVIALGTDPLGTGGSNSVTLNANNLPPHQHRGGLSAQGASYGSLTTGSDNQKARSVNYTAGTYLNNDQGNSVANEAFSVQNAYVHLLGWMRTS